MPMNVKKIDRIAVNKICKTPLFANNNIKRPVVHDDGAHLTTNYKINPITQLILVTADKLSPIMLKHPKIGKVLVITCERFIKLSEKFSNEQRIKI